jgi:hypothetical protein
MGGWIGGSVVGCLGGLMPGSYEVNQPPFSLAQRPVFAPLARHSLLLYFHGTEQCSKCARTLPYDHLGLPGCPPLSAGLSRNLLSTAVLSVKLLVGAAVIPASSASSRKFSLPEASNHADNA